VKGPVEILPWNLAALEKKMVVLLQPQRSTLPQDLTTYNRSHRTLLNDLHKSQMMIGETMPTLKISLRSLLRGSR
jgi:hypothetical protein